MKKTPKNKSRIAGKPEDYTWSKSDQLFKHNSNGRFLSHKQARGIGLKIPATQPEQIAPLAPAPDVKKNSPAETLEPPVATISIPAPVPDTASRPDSEIFGNLPPEPEKPAADEIKNQAQPETSVDDDASASAETTSEDHRGLASAIWDGAIGIISGLIGKFWQPRAVGNDPQKNEIPYDERELVISAMCAYFKHVGMAVMSPVQNLWLAIFTYASPRLHETFMVIKLKFFTKRAQPGPQPTPGDSRMPGPDKTQPAPAPAQNPAPPQNAETQAILLGKL